MAKQKKQPPAGRRNDTADKVAAVDPQKGSGAKIEPRPPARRPVLLAVSIVLFGLWLLFLIVTALRQA